MSFRSYPRTLDEKIAQIEEQLRRLRQFQAEIPNAATLSATSDAAFGEPISSIFGEDGAEGTSASAARADHEHDRRTDWAWHFASVAP